MKILLVEDRSDITSALTGTLRRMISNCEILTACYFEDAQKALESNKIDVVITDMKLTGYFHGGLELSHIARRTNPDAKLVLYTGNIGEEEDVTEVIHAHSHKNFALADDGENVVTPNKKALVLNRYNSQVDGVISRVRSRYEDYFDYIVDKDTHSRDFIKLLQKIAGEIEKDTGPALG